jgi:phage tail-like protein
MATPTNWYKRFAFLVEIDGVERAAFKSATDLAAIAETIEYREGGRRHPHKAPGLVSFEPITLERGVAEGDDTDLLNWFRSTYDAAAATGQNLPALYRTVSIVQLDMDGSVKRRFTLYNAWCKEYRINGWDNDANEVSMESLVFEFDRYDVTPAA